MPIEIKLSTVESVRRAKQADPALTESQLMERFGIRRAVVEKALRYKQPGGRKPGRQRA